VQIPEAAADGVWSAGRRALTLGLVLTITLVGFEALAVATVMPVVSDDLGGIGLYGWVFSAFFLGSLVGIVFAGRSADRHGPERAFVVGLVLFAAGLFGCGLAPTMHFLVAARAVQGLGAGAIPALAYVAIGRAYPTELQARMFAIISSAWVLPAVLGPALSGVIADAFGWRWVFLGLLPLVLLAALITTPALRALGAPGGREPVDKRANALLLAFGAGLVVAGASSRTLFLAIPMVGVGAIVGGRAFARLMPRGTLRLARGTPAAIVARGLATFAFFGVDAFVSFTLHDVRGASTTLAGVALSAATLGWTAGSWVQERRVQRVGPRSLVRAGMLLMAAGILGMIVVAQFAVPIAVAVIVWGIGGLGMGITYSPLTLIVLSEAEAGGEGTASASLQLSDQLGVALGTGVSGAIVAAGAALDWSHPSTLTIAFGLCAVFAVAGSVVSRRLPRVLG
jgi:MFS family permease